MDGDTDGDTDTDTDSETEDGPDADADSDTDTGECGPPDYSDDCAEVISFQCGFDSWCTNGWVAANWHVHGGCPPDYYPEIWNYSCSHQCPYGCDPSWNPYSTWPPSGQELVENACLEAPPDGGV